jgi:uncharacterized protein (TIGR00288 family)
MDAADERIALFIDYENLAIGAREGLRGHRFDMRPIADALAARGRVVVRKAYADWSYFDEDRRMLTRNHVELIEIPQRMGAVRKNAADIKLAVDAIELSFERDFITTFAICTGDSDFTPLVHKLRELNKKVIGIGVKTSTSALLPPACDEFLFYERLEGIDLTAPPPATSATSRSRSRGGTSRSRSRTTAAATEAPAEEAATEEAATEGAAPAADDTEAPKPRPRSRSRKKVAEPEAPPAEAAPGEDGALPVAAGPAEPDLAKLVTQTLGGIQRSLDGAVTASMLKRTILRRDPTFDESDYGFRGFGELLGNLESRGVVTLAPGPAQGDPEVDFPKQTQEEDGAFRLLRDVVAELQRKGGPQPLSGLKNKLRRRQADFSEKRFGYAGFLQFVTAARARGFVDMEWDDEADDYVIEASGNVV